MQVSGFVVIIPYAHTFATRALENGVPAKVVSAMLGHADVALTLNTYTHLLKETIRDQVLKMNGIFVNGAAAGKENQKGKKNPARER